MKPSERRRRARRKVHPVVAARRPPRRWTLAVLLLAFLALAAVGSVSRFYTDLLWFREIDKTGLFWGMLRTKAVTDGYTGTGPDLGALETGQPLPHWGPRFEGPHWK